MRKLPLLFLFPVASIVSAADFTTAASATNGFGLDLFRQVATSHTGKNLALSPYSITSAFAMAYAGAEGDTREEMRRVLGFPSDDGLLQVSLFTLNQSLDATVKKASARDIDVEWHLANRIFAERDYPFRDAFITLLRDGYRAPLQPLDFKHDSEAGRGTINRWVEEQTKQKIRNLIPPGGLTGDTRLVLVNALYLKTPWASRFEPDATTEKPFQLSPGKSVNVPTMSQVMHVGFIQHDGFTVLSLPYVAQDLQFVILLPDDANGTDNLLGKVSPQLLAECANLGTKNVKLFLPKFRIEGTTIPLGKTLQGMGMKSAFDIPAGSANFDRAAPRKPGDYLAISEVFHQAFVAVDEHGTEAAAATAVTLMTLSVMANPPPPPLEVHVDRPFFFAIQHRPSGACLFLGRIVDPR